MANKKKVLLFNPWATSYHPRLPNSILHIAASIEGLYDYFIVDGNLEKEPWEKIENYIKTENIGYFGCTVMPGPQLKQAIPYAKKIKEKYPDIKIIWGGYFPSSYPTVTLNSGYVDVIANGMGDKCFPDLLECFEKNEPIEHISNIIYKSEDKIIKTKKDKIYDLDELNDYPFKKLNSFYPIEKYLAKTHLGSKTIAYHSSFGCPFTCSFCAVVPIYNATWKGKSAELIYKDVKYLKDNYGANAIEFHDNNFFVSEKRTVEFANLIKSENMIWWGQARIDTLDKFSDKSLFLIRESGCTIIYFGAESGNDEILKQMDKGGTQTVELMLSFAERLKKFDIIPEYSLILGTPASSDNQVIENLNNDISFIRKLKEINPKIEIVIYTYNPIPIDGSEIHEKAVENGFKYPETLEDWISSDYESFNLRKTYLTPWLKPKIMNKIHNFNTVFNGFYPTFTDVKLTPFMIKLLKTISYWRYKTQIYNYPKEIRFFHKILKYRQPEIEGF